MKPGRKSRGSFQVGDFVDVVWNFEGKGFQGVVKRHGLGGRALMVRCIIELRFIGASADPARVFKGTKMGGQMGNVRKNIQNIQVCRFVP